MKKGFTLIELVIVIVILGILAAVAIPKFVNLQSDARKSALKGLSGAVQSAASIGYAKYQLGPVTSGTNYDNVTINGENVYFHKNGYPKASTDGIVKLLDNASGDLEVSGGGNTGDATLTIKYKGYDTNCKIEYKDNDTNNTFKITLTETGC